MKLKKFAYDTTGLPAVVNDQSLELLIRSFYEGKTGSTFAKQTGIKSTADLHYITTELFYQADTSCAFNASGKTGFSARTITVGKIKVQQEFCAKELEGFWTERALRPGTMYDYIAFEQDFTNFLVGLLTEAKETALWQSAIGGGGGSNLTQFNGFNKIILDASATTINGNPSGITTATGITSANVVTIFDTMWGLLPARLKGKSDLMFMCGSDTFDKLILALKAANLFYYDGVNGSAYQSQELILPGTGIKVVAFFGLDTTNRIHLGRTSNFIIGTDLESDEDMFNIRENPITLTMMLDIHFKLGTQIKFPNEIVTFKLV
jgi:hypothetical protein